MKLSSSLFTLLTLLLGVHTKPTAKRQALATVYSSCVVPNTAAMTFDDGPYIYLQTISDHLTNAGARGTFCFNGNNFDCIYNSESIQRVQYAFNAGHQIVSHTWAHADLLDLSNTQINDAMFRMEEAFSRILGVKPAFMRPPFGDFNDNVRTISASRGQNLALWDWDTGDADGNTTAQSEAVYQDAVNARVSNMLVLNHETEETTADILVPFAINLLQSHGYNLVTLADCLGVDAYSQVGTPQAQTAAWTCNGTPDPGVGCSGTQCETGQITVNNNGGPGNAGSGGNGGGTAPPPPPTPVPNQVIHPSIDSTKCLAAASNANNAAVTIQTCDGSTSQLWSLTGFNIQIFGNKCLDVTSGSAVNGNLMQIFTCNSGNANQQWTTPTAGGAAGAIQWQSHTFCLDNTGGVDAAGNPTQIWTCTGGTNQKWAIASPSGTTTPPPPPPASGKTIRPGSGASSCLTVQTQANNAAVVVEPCISGGSVSQQWTQTSTGTLSIYSGTLCLDVTSGSTTPGTKMQVFACTAGNTNQQFVVSASKQIQWKNQAECLDLTNGALTAGNVVQMWTCVTGNTNQVWNFV